MKHTELSSTSYAKKPKMILFDVGGTLFEDGKCNFKDGFEALRLTSLNPDATTADFLAERWDEYIEDMKNLESATGIHLDFPLSAIIKYATMKAGLKFGISLYEQEELFDRFNSARKVIEGIPGLLKALKNQDIRTAIISNNAMSGESLSLAIRHWIPEADFEFCLTSADILYTKPCKHIFEAAINYTTLKPEDCWYCGDSFIPDVLGASGCNIAPILIDKEAEAPFEVKKINDGNYLIINHWDVLTDIIKNF